ncbi:MAG: MFS transporter [Chromatiaceae bacterium]|nr:MFS transporter [Chromatiaceae bacterium]MBP6733177.1 MFS transporter [Chromatiaceae bacterium]MBP8288240.1 MFS transporter [Chromatiaceae bacterium]
MLRTLFSLPRTVWLIGLISLLNDSASEMIYPLVPLYLASVLMAGPRALGLIEGIAEATASLLKLFSGVIVDHTCRAKPWVVAGYALAGFARPLIAFATSWPGLLLLRFADRVGKGLRTSPRDALLAGSVDPSVRGLAFGLHRAMDNAGAVVGPLFAALLLGLGWGLRDVFLFAIVPAVACLGLALMLREPKPDGKRPKPTAFSWRLVGLPPAFRRYLVVLALFTLGNSSNMFLLLRARELGLPEAQVPLAWAAVSFIAMLFSTPLSALSDRVGRVRLIVVGWVAYGSFYLGLGLLPPGTPLALFGLFAFYGVFMAATEGVEKALVADLAPPDLRGTAFGWFNLTAGLMLLPASLLFGALYQGAGALAAFAFSAAFALTAALLLPFWALRGASLVSGVTRCNGAP